MQHSTAAEKVAFLENTSHSAKGRSAQRIIGSYSIKINLDSREWRGFHLVFKHCLEFTFVMDVMQCSLWKWMEQGQLKELLDVTDLDFGQN